MDLNHIPAGWKSVKIPKVLFFQEGPGVRKWQFTEEGVKLLNVGNINNGKVNLSKTKIFLSKEEANGKYSHFLVDEGDLLIACSGIVVDNFPNKIAFAEKNHLPLCLNTSTMRFKPLDEELIDLHYFKYFLQTVHFSSQLRKLITGSAQLNFGPSHIKKISLLLPPLDTQKRIAQILDDANALRQKTEKLLEEYDTLAQSIFLDMFGDPVTNPKGFDSKSLSKVGSFKNGLNFSKGEKGYSVKYIGVGDFKSKVKIDDLNTLSEVELEKAPNEDYFLKDGDLLFVRSNGNKSLVGRCIAVYPGQDKVTFSGFCIKFSPINEVKSTYLSFLFRTASMKQKMLGGGRGANIQNVNQQILGRLKVPVPIEKLQIEFTEKITLIEKQKELAKQELAESEDLFNCLLQKAFKGELI